jgi:ATP-dependent DNA helicase RecQ
MDSSDPVQFPPFRSQAHPFSSETVLDALKRYWGYEAFRPRQEKIVRSILELRDTCVIMPTGGGKSLCYQLPAALLAERTAMVISPLIALMQDQVAQLTQMGISAAFLNSSLSAGEQSAIVRKARGGAYRLLYLSPERLARQDTLNWLGEIPLSFFAIDEAHCISEWGHEFRPEYRQMSALRKAFPRTPIAAFTASATKRVRHDIIQQLQLNNPDKYIASFHRPNLHYIIKQCKPPEQRALLLKALRKYEGSSVILYAATIKGVEATVRLLEEQGIAAVAYHGKMDAETRRANQEKWTSDEALVMVGTNAFGLGINKAAVRAVIHLSLPKSIEQYYQEAGRAGRDGEKSECLMLWQKKDAGTLAYFAGEIQDAMERNRAWDRYREIMGFVESEECRHKLICKHFGESKEWKSCGACDACLGMPEWFAQRGRSEERRPVRGEGDRRPELTPSLPAEQSQGGAGALREHLRQWRREMAKRQGIAAFIVMHDTTLDALCARQPRTLGQLRSVPGIGDRKIELYGLEILSALEQFRNDRNAVGSAKPQQRKASAGAAS